MSRYYQVIANHAEQPPPGEGRQPDHELHRAARQTAGSAALVAIPVARAIPGALARVPALRSLSERIAPQAALDRSLRLMVSGCRVGDGASAVTAALAMDLSTRLGLRTLVVDANPRSQGLHRMLDDSRRKTPDLLHGPLLIRTTLWPKLELASCSPAYAERDSQQLITEVDTLASEYPAVVVDLGVVRLDPRMLPLARPNDPIVLVVRYGHTERRELSTTAAALQAANREVAGVILNAANQPATEHHLKETIRA